MPIDYEFGRRNRLAEGRGGREAAERESDEATCFNRDGRLLTVTVVLTSAGVATVQIWTRFRHGVRRRITPEFRNVKFHRRIDRAAILANTPPTLRREVERLFNQIVPDYRWTRVRNLRGRVA